MSRSTAKTGTTESTAELRYVPPDALEPNPWNPNVMDPPMFEHARASIDKFGFVDPITVRRLGDYHWQIIDGYHRWVIAAERGFTRVPIFDLGEVEDSVAKQLTIVLNETRGQADPAKLGELLRDLMAKETKETLLSALPYTREAFDRLTGLPALDWEDLESRRPQLSGERPSAWVERVYRMPKDAAEMVDRAIAKIREDGDEVMDWQALELICADYLGGS